MQPVSTRLNRAVRGTLVGLALGAAFVGSAGAAPGAAPVTPATEIHGLPGNNPAFGGSSANPEGGGVNGGNGMHAINDGAPGHDGASGAAGGQPPACTIHGGMADNDGNHDNRNCTNNQ